MKLYTKIYSKINIQKRLVMFLLLLSLCFQYTYPQYKIHYDNDYLTDLTFGPERSNGFRITLSLVAIFTTGASDRNGFRLGGGVTFSQTIDNWTLSTGIDAYKVKQKFGIGTTFVGAKFDDGRYGGSYYLNKYYQGGRQVSGIVGVHLNDFQISFEDDILAFPVLLKIYDRYRTAALEVRYKHFVLGTNVYTTDINGLTDISAANSRGVYVTGRQISSPVYVGYSANNLVLRYGLNNRAGGYIGQNSWHRQFFMTPDFNTGKYNNQFLQVGVDKFYTLY